VQYILQSLYYEFYNDFVQFIRFIPMSLYGTQERDIVPANLAIEGKYEKIVVRFTCYGHCWNAGFAGDRSTGSDDILNDG